MKNFIYTLFILHIFGLVKAQTTVNMPDANSISPGPTHISVYPNNYSGNILLNYTREITPIGPASTDVDLSYLRSRNLAIEVTKYTDGFSRPLQVVTKKSANGYTKDLVYHYNYDEKGRVSCDLLPFAKGDKTIAAENKFDKNVYTDLRQTYSALGYAGEDFLYSETIYEPALRGGIVEQRSQGNGWAGIGVGVTTLTRKLKLSDNLVRLTINHQYASVPLYSSTAYTVDEAIVKVVTDEDGNVNQSFIDIDGNVIAKQIGSLRTYYVYDIYSKLRCIITPKAVDELIGNNWDFTTDIRQNLCFRFEYDSRGNQILLRKPGVAYQSFQYDMNNRVILSQDGIQRQNNKWVFYKYDTKGRLVQQGEYVDVGANQVGSGGGSEYGTYTNVSNSFLWYLYNKKITNSSHYEYSFNNTSFFVHYYFDDYTFIDRIASMGGVTAAQLGFVQTIANATEGFSAAKSIHTNGYLTGMYVAVSDNSNWLSKVNYYNERGEVIQTVSDDLNNKISVNGFGYDYPGNLTKTVFQNPDLTLQKKYGYDYHGNLRSISHKAGNAASFRKIAQYDYDEIGRLKLKQLGAMKYPVNYEYNIRNWITGINKQYVNSSNNTMFFGIDVKYNYGYDANFNNGRIAGIKWRTKGSSQEVRSYGYLYDNQQQLKKADYYYDSELLSPEDDDWTKQDKDFTTDNLSYDANGNILSMKHMGIDASNSPIVLDDLSYSYEQSSNKLASVTESNISQSTDPNQHDGLGDFRDATGSTDYSYDANGNLTNDNNRGVTINSNWFNVNKPIQTTLVGTLDNKVDYIYDALGNCIRKKITSQPNSAVAPVVKIIDYIGEVTYEDNIPKLITNEEGRIRIELTATNQKIYMYDYYLKDHIDNIRCIIAESPEEGSDMVPYDPSIFELSDPNSTVDLSTLPTDPIGYIATSEISNAGWENELFENIGETRSGRPGQIEDGDYQSAELTASSGNVIGPGKLIKVMAGDKIELGAEAFFYSGSNPSNAIPINTIVSQIISAMISTASVTGEIANAFSQANLSGAELSLALNDIQSQESDTSLPQAYLNYLMFDEGFNIMPDVSGAIQVEQANAWQTMDVAQFDIAQNGYLYVFTSNQSQASVNTDNLYIYHWQSRLLEEFNYYPFGLTFEVSHTQSLSGSNTRYNSQSIERNEFTDNSNASYGLNWYDFMARSYDMQIGRWMQPDPLMQHASPYLAMANNPTSFTDPLGLTDGQWVGIDEATGQVVRRGGSFDGPDQTYLLRKIGDEHWMVLNNYVPDGIKYASSLGFIPDVGDYSRNDDNYHINYSQNVINDFKIRDQQNADRAKFSSVVDRLGSVFTNSEKHFNGSIGTVGVAVHGYNKIPNDIKRHHAHNFSKLTGIKSGKVFQGAKSFVNSTGKLVSKLGPAGTILGVGVAGYEIGTDTWDAHTAVNIGLMAGAAAATFFAAPAVLTSIAIYGVGDYFFDFGGTIDNTVGRKSGVWRP